MLEKQLRKETQKSVRKDRALWLEELAGRGDWESLRKLRSKNTASQTRLKDIHGEIVSSELRAETLADHLEQLQWRVRPVTLQPDPPAIIHPPLPVAENLFTMVELRKAALNASKQWRTLLATVWLRSWNYVTAVGPLVMFQTTGSWHEWR